MKLSEVKDKDDLAWLCGIITADGHLQNSGHRKLTSFYSKNMDEIKKVNNCVRKLFMIEGCLYPCERAHKLFFISKKITIFLQEVGVPIGNKTNCVFSVPKFIKKGSKKLKFSYLRGLYDGEGYIYSSRTKNKIRWRIGIEFYKNKILKEQGLNFLNELRELLLEGDIKSSPVRIKKGNKRKDGSESIGFVTDIEKSSFRKFYKYVGFGSDEKQKKLLFALAD